MESVIEEQEIINSVDEITEQVQELAIEEEKKEEKKLEAIPPLEYIETGEDNLPVIHIQVEPKDSGRSKAWAIIPNPEWVLADKEARKSIQKYLKISAIRLDDDKAIESCKKHILKTYPGLGTLEPIGPAEEISNTDMPSLLNKVIRKLPDSPQDTF